MIVLAHAVHWLEPVLFAVPAAAVAVSIARSLRTRRSPEPHAREEAAR